MLEEVSEKPPEKVRKTRVSKANKDKANNENLAKTLQGLHVVIALGLNLPELAINETEATMQADAIDRVMSEYDIPISPATQALVNLAFVSFAIYAPKIHAIKVRKETELKETEKEKESVE